MAEFLHIAINFQGRAASAYDFAPILSKAQDWVRYAPNCWIIWTSATADVWYARVKPLLHDDDSVFICKLDLGNRSGYLPGLVWDWLDRDRSRHSDAGIMAGIGPRPLTMPQASSGGIATNALQTGTAANSLRGGILGG